MCSRGLIPAEPECLRTVRELTRTYDALLILDEVMSFRIDTSRAQSVYGVEPDLTTFAKIICGGLPVGAFGGREDVVRVFDPATGAIHHCGTFNANPMTIAAGRAAMREGGKMVCGQPGTAGTDMGCEIRTHDPRWSEQSGG